MLKLKGLKIGNLVVYAFVGAFLLIARFFFKYDDLLPLAVFIILSIVCAVTLFIASQTTKEDYEEIENALSSMTKVAMQEGKIGVIIYDQNYKVTYISEFLRNALHDHVGEKILNWLPDLQDIVSGGTQKKVIVINDEKYEVAKQNNSSILIFRDISLEYDLKDTLKKRSAVLGMCTIDNFDETSASEDGVSFVSANIKMPTLDYFRQMGIVYKTLRNNVIQLYLDKEKYDALLKDRFSILNTIRKEGKKAGLDYTLSMSFAIDYTSLDEMDKEAISLLELAQTRGGDQVATRVKDKEPIFYGGNSEAKERTSKVKVRVMANTLRKLIEEASNVIIVGHAMADSDCVGSMLGAAMIAKTINEETYVLADGIGIEPMTKDALALFRNEIVQDVKIINEYDASNKINRDTLLIMCDHHSLTQTSSPGVVKMAEKVVVIDHHRRKAVLDINAILLYVEASASSTCELMSEFFEYIPRIRVSSAVANIMYLGMVIDTNHFRVRTGIASFDAAKTLKKLGVNIELVERLAQEPYEMVQKRTKIISQAEKYKEKFLISKMPEDEMYPRSIASQACDSLISTREIAAAFVICKTEGDEVLISARSKGETNVQVILEKLNGGGHKTAAGLQRKNTSVGELSAELINALDEYLGERQVEENESNTTK